jgi:hypothetical protein
VASGWQSALDLDLVSAAISPTLRIRGTTQLLCGLKTNARSATDSDERKRLPVEIQHLGQKEQESQAKYAHSKLSARSGIVQLFALFESLPYVSGCTVESVSLLVRHMWFKRRSLKDFPGS